MYFCLFFRSSKAEHSGTTTTIGLYFPIILCAPLAYIDLAVDVAKLVKFWMLRRLLKLPYGSILVSPWQEMRKEKRCRTDKEQYANIFGLIHVFFAHFVTFKDKVFNRYHLCVCVFFFFSYHGLLTRGIIISRDFSLSCFAKIYQLVEYHFSLFFITSLASKLCYRRTCF